MKNCNNLNKKWKKRITILLFMLPAAIPLFIFWIYPMIDSIFISFTDWDYISTEYNIVGLDNYKDLLTSEAFYSALKNTFVFMLGTVIPTIIIGLAIAVLLKSKLKGSSIYKAIIFSPWITPTVAISIVWCWIFNPDTGLANYILELLNMPKLQWLQSSDTAMLSVIIVTVWKQMGWAMIFYITALEKVPKGLYEAAEIDGAGKFNAFKHITLPLISPTTFFLSIILMIDSLKAYDAIRVLTQGGPSGSTRTMLYLYYETAFENFNTGQATAIATMLLLIVALLALIQFAASKKWVYYNN